MGIEINDEKRAKLLKALEGGLVTFHVIELLQGMVRRQPANDDRAGAEKAAEALEVRAKEAANKIYDKLLAELQAA